MIKICDWTCNMTSRSYFGKMNSILGSVVPLAMFKLMLGRDSEDENWSRFVFELVIWTQPWGPLCLWQCFMTCPRKGFFPSALISKNILLFWNGICLLTFQPTNYSNFKVLTPGCALSILIFVFINRNLCFVNKFFWTTFLLVS